MPVILLVDDDPLFQYLVQRYVQRSGCELVSAENSTEALLVAQRERPALIVLDLMLPTEDGWLVLQRLKSDARTGTIPVAICASVLDQTRAVNEGADYCLPKPLMYDDLLHVLLDAKIPVAA